MMLRQPIAMFGPLVVLLASGMCHGQSPAPAATTPDGVEFFEKKVRPLLSEHCFQCHSAAAPKGIKGGLSLDNREALRGGENGPAVVPGSADGSRLIRAVRWKDDKLQMPPKKALTAEQVAVLEQWVAMGGADPRVAAAAAARRGQRGDDAGAGEEVPAFQPVEARRCRRSRTSPGPNADRRASCWRSWRRRGCRRAAGGPADADPARHVRPDRPAADAGGGRGVRRGPSPDAFEKVVDRLLASPAYGERWGRHWLDVARYADTDGYERRPCPVPTPGAIATT